MAQKLRDDKIGQLTHSVGNIIMAASSSSPAYLTIGGQQYKITANLIIALPSLIANGRYQVFAVLNAGVVELRISQNENSVGPAGFNRWKLIGSLYANGMSPVAFGSFVNIKGSPKSGGLRQNSTSLAFVGFGTPANVEGMLYRNGRTLSGRFYIEAGTVTTADARFGIANLTIDTQEVLNSRRTQWGEYKAMSDDTPADWDAGAFGILYHNPTYANELELTDSYQIVSGEGLPSQVGADSILGSTNSIMGTFDNVPIQGWSDTSIEDL